MNMPDHLTDNLLVRAIDGELSPGETPLVESHLSDCELCKRRHAAILRVSGDIESLLSAVVPETYAGDRAALVRSLETRPALEIASKNRSKAMPAMWWSAGIAAAILLAAFSVWPRVHTPAQTRIIVSMNSPGTTLQVDGETFIPLPYSNPDLPVTAPHIVEMQVPVSSLASAGLVFEPVSTGSPIAERSVLADVLMGIDGQPLGVHVLSVE